ncbi:MAG TPA: beta-L-arabinofuranosidase domain-containing protein [Bryobacteraceae bacterium]
MRRVIASMAILCAAASAQPRVAQVVRNRAPLAQTGYTPLPLGSVMPLGWLERQLRIQANGLSGHLEEFWPDLGPNSAWLGGSGEGWERGPYYLDGLVPLAYLLNDPTLIRRAQKWVNWAIENQRPDGAIGPAKNTDWWPNYIMIKALTQYQEVTGDPRVIPLLERYFAYMAANLDQRPLKQWAIFRWQDQALTVLWLYNRNGDPKLLDLAKKLHAQGHDWAAQFADFKYKGKVTKDQLNLATHVVNNAQGLKTAAVWYEVTGDKRDLDALRNQFEQLDRYQLLPNGAHSGDEHYAGTNPTQGSELCSIVEAMFSLENIVAITGEPAYGDRLEKLAYNPLPGTFSKDMWAHQYDQQANQVLVSVAKRDWTNNEPDSNLYGLEPNFGCCTANMHQGFPKFVAALWMATPRDGLAAVAYGPSRVTAPVRGNVPVTITEETEYPFREKVKLLVNPSAPVTFPLELRVPAWATRASVTVNGKAVQGIRAGSFLTVEREWKPGDRVEIVLPMQPRISRWYHNSVAVERGPLVYSLKIGEDWKKVKDRPQAPDWEVLPTTPWNYGLIVDTARPERSFHVEEKPVGEYPFSPEGAPVALTAKARRIPDWKLVNDSAGPLPESPARSSAPVETVTLIPYGSAKLRITAFPLLAK